ncbi:Lrp/AsnC family transcriptional regulator [Rhizobium sp. L1K21]|uniref:Lrp/AsnC family transcriptional regulator n=1 Tax=Rhizobium sp. L1K21 TaxID=2954933 RepID=UPI0020928B60|nr:Lrp/AsnC ligand binding domain-containing protein [Rhizobium sp. L1K21]MCO6187476.1 Lrp/AsnC ligand binding domain-containing protein [Rhizobium sp. L1K21]
MDRKTDNPGELDHWDRKIMNELNRDGRMSVTELASRVGLSKTPCQVRMKKLVDHGYIDGFKAVLNPAKLGLSHVAFVEVKLTDTRDEALRGFNAAAKKVPEIEECHMIAGRFDYLLKVRTSSIHRFRLVLGESISSLPHVANTSTSFVMEPIKENWG